MITTDRGFFGRAFNCSYQQPHPNSLYPIISTIIIFDVSDGSFLNPKVKSSNREVAFCWSNRVSQNVMDSWSFSLELSDTHSLQEQEASPHAYCLSFLHQCKIRPRVSLKEWKEMQWTVLNFSINFPNCGHFRMSWHHLLVVSLFLASINWLTVSKICGPCAQSLHLWLLPLPEAIPKSWVKCYLFLTDTPLTPAEKMFHWVLEN